MSRSPQPLHTIRNAYVFLIAAWVLIAVVSASGCAAVLKAAPLLQTGLDLLDFGQELIANPKDSLEKIKYTQDAALWLAECAAYDSSDTITIPAKAEGESPIAYTVRLLLWVSAYRQSVLEAEGLIEPAE